MEWVRGFQIPPREIFVVHGEPDSSNALAGLIRAELGFNATVPTWRQTVNLIAASAADPLRTVYASLSSKLRNLLDCDLPQSQREEIIRRMTDLETYLDEGLKKTG